MDNTCNKSLIESIVAKNENHETGGIKHDNIYLDDYGISQIQLFNLLATKVPQVALTGKLAIDVIISDLQSAEIVQIVDLGIGTGRFIANLIPELVKKTGVKNIEVIGLEPSKTSLELAEKNIKEAGEIHGIKTTFIGIHCLIEETPKHVWREIAFLVKNPVVVASFALHHIKESNGATRTDILKNLKEFLAPRLLLLLEPNIDHHTDDKAKRVKNCKDHFAKTFDVIDELDITHNEKSALKINFFGREIVDITLNSDHQRSERHEPVMGWAKKLEAAGFSPVQLPLSDVTSDHIQIKVENGYYSLEKDGYPLTSVIVYR